MSKNDGSDVRCHEVRSHQNKTFKLSRIEWVGVTILILLMVVANLNDILRWLGIMY